MKTGGGDWRDVSISLEHSAATSHLMGHLMLGEAGRTRPLSLQREHSSASAWVSDSGLQAVRECVCCFKPPFW